MPDIDPDQSFGPPGQFINPAYATPEQSALLRALATKNLTQQPEAKSWAGVLGGLAQTWGGLQQQQQANQVDQARFAEAARLQSGIGQQGGNGLLGGAPPNGGGGGSIADSYGPGIAKLESGGNYGAVGPKTRNGDHGYGKYQVMGKNIPGWTQEVLGQSLTPQQFLANPQAQEAVFKAKFNQYGSQTGSPQDAASMWFSGKPMAQALASGNKADVNGMRPSAYVQAALRGGGQQMAQASPTTGMNGPQYGAIMANPSISQETKNQYQHAQTPQTFADATGGIHAMAPGQAPAGQLTPGNIQAPVSAAGVSATTSTPTIGGVAQPGKTQMLMPNAQGGGGGNNPFVGLANQGAEVSNIGDAQKEIGKNLDQVEHANQMAGKIETIKELGANLKNGALPIWAAAGLRFGINTSDEAGRYAVYKAEIQDILRDRASSGGDVSGLSENIPALGAPPDARDAFADFLAMPYKYQQARSKRIYQGLSAGEDPMTIRKGLADIPQPQTTYTRPPPAGGGGGGGGGGTSNASAREQPKYHEGQTATGKDGKTKMIFKGGKWQPL